MATAQITCHQLFDHATYSFSYVLSDTETRSALITRPLLELLRGIYSCCASWGLTCGTGHTDLLDGDAAAFGYH